MSDAERDFSKASQALDDWLDEQGEEGDELIDPASIPYSTPGVARSTGISGAPNHRGACSGQHRGHALAGVTTLLGSSFRDGLVVPGNSVTVLLAREPMTIALPVGWASYRSPEFNSHLRGALVFWPWKDLSVPTDVEGAARRILELHRIHQMGKTIEVACYGGHGRTGTLLAILAALHQGWRADEAVDRLREAYCGRAVESEVQETFVRLMVEQLSREGGA